MNLFGIPVFPSPLMVEQKETRIKGGYLNRWLIRAVVTVPSTKVIHDRMNNRMYCHPDVIQQIRRQLPSHDMPWAFK